MTERDDIPVKEEYADVPVPQSERRHWIKPSMVWLGFSTQFLSFYVGGQVERAVGMPGAVIGIMLGCVFLVALSGSIAWGSTKYGWSFPMQCRGAFGTVGFRLPSLFLAVLVNGWFAYQAITTGDVWGKAYGLPTGILAAIFALMFAFTALHFKFMIYARWFAIPALIVMIAYMFIYTIIPNWQLAWTHKVANPNFPMAISVGISFFIISSIMTGDIVRWTRLSKRGSPLPSLWVTIFAFIAGNGIALSIGAIATAASPELSEWFGLVGIHLSIPLVVCVLGINWASGDGCLYNATVGYANISKKFKWKWALAIGAVIGAIAAGSAVLKTVLPWMLAIGTIVPPIGGVILSDYWFVRGKKYGYYEFERKIKWNWFGLISWAVGFLVALLQLRAAPGFPNQITGVVVSAALYFILARGFGRNLGFFPDTVKDA